MHFILVAKHFAANGRFTRLDGADFNVNGAWAILLKINGLIRLFGRPEREWADGSRREGCGGVRLSGEGQGVDSPPLIRRLRNVSGVSLPFEWRISAARFQSLLDFLDTLSDFFKRLLGRDYTETVPVTY